VWDTTKAGTSASNQITLPIVASGVYDFRVFWGDGTMDTVTVGSAGLTHTFPAPGIYQVTIIGKCWRWTFANGGDCLKIIEIKNWGSGFRVAPANSGFYGCANLVLSMTDVLDIPTNSSFSSQFRNCTFASIPQFERWNMANVTNLQNTFAGNPNYDQEFPHAVTAVNNMSAMYQDCTSFNSPLAFTGVSVTSFASMFYNAQSFNQPVTNFNTAKATSFNTMFRRALAFRQSISHFQVSLVTTMNNMFLQTEMTTEDYDVALISFAGQTVKPNVPWHVGTSRYTPGGAAEAARNVLTSAPNNWVITDGGPVT